MLALTFADKVAVVPLIVPVTLTFAAALTSAVTFAVPVIDTFPVILALPVMFASTDALTFPVTVKSPVEIAPKFDKILETLKLGQLFNFVKNDLDIANG